MSTSGCTSFFSEREAERFLNRNSMNALHQIKQEKELGEAGIEGLEQCPYVLFFLPVSAVSSLHTDARFPPSFCPFAYIIDNPHERLFHCQRSDCGVVSCRQCKKVRPPSSVLLSSHSPLPSISIFYYARSKTTSHKPAPKSRKMRSCRWCIMSRRR
jgi:hypothetical protein